MGKERNILQNDNIKKLKIIGAVIIAVIAAIVLIMIIGSSAGKPNKSRVINMDDFVHVKVDETAINGMGKAEINIDFNYLDSVIGPEKIKQAYETRIGPADDLTSPPGTSDLFGYNAENVSNLKNGDVVRITFFDKSDSNETAEEFQKLCQDLGVSMSNTYEYAVTGLTEGQIVNMTPENIEEAIRFTGTQGNGGVEIDTPDTYSVNHYYYMKRNGSAYDVIESNKKIGSLLIKTIRLKETGEEDVTRKAVLSAGEKVRILVTPDDELKEYLAAEQIAVEETSFVINVPKLGNYIRSASEISVGDIRDIGRKLLEEKNYQSVTAVYSAELKPTEVAEESDRIHVLYLINTGKGESELYGASGLSHDTDGTLRYEDLVPYITEPKEETQPESEWVESSLEANTFKDYVIKKIDLSEIMNEKYIEQNQPSEETGKQSVEVTAESVDVHNAPDAASEVVSSLKKGDAADVIRTETTGDDTWYQIGENMYVLYSDDAIKVSSSVSSDSVGTKLNEPNTAEGDAKAGQKTE